MRRSLLILLLLVGLLFFYSLGGPGFLPGMVKALTYSKRKLTRANPTSYVFHVPVAELRNALPQWGPDTPCPPAPNPCLILEHPTDGTRYDLWQLDRTKSDVYQWFGRPLLYRARYIATVTPVSDAETRIDIRARESNVLLATNAGVHGGDFIDAVPPTTIEEYRFLLMVGGKVAEKDMPPLQLPH